MPEDEFQREMARVKAALTEAAGHRELDLLLGENVLETRRVLFARGEAGFLCPVGAVAVERACRESVGWAAWREAGWRV